MKNTARAIAITPSICPLCLHENHCEVDKKEGCWCMSAYIPTSLRNQIPTELKNKACLCLSCIEKAKTRSL
ncbi:MAG TPA: hypothetical protein EYH12_06015 [Psychromonas hadalis]|nr:hypothetical protein [Psychromonas hadalis]